MSEESRKAETLRPSEHALYQQATVIAAMLRQRANSNGLQMFHRDELNGFYGQTESGLFIEIYYGMPSRIWTPWGEWRIGGSGVGHHDHEAFIMEKFGATVHTPKKIDRMGEHGPVYALHSVNGVALPEPIACAKGYEGRITYAEANAAWAELRADKETP